MDTNKAASAHRSNSEESDAAADSSASREPQGVESWVRYLSDQGLPTFAHTAHQVAGVVSDRDSSAAELTRVVLQDAAMTAKLLRIANSPLYNQSGRGVSTVSRAVILLGFDTVRSLCLSIAVVESFTSGKRKHELAKEMARSFHAAVQARAFAELRKDESPEEVFIASLLYNLGKLAFWARADGQAQELAGAIQASPDQDPEIVEESVLGFKLQQLTAELSREWKLGSLLEHALAGKKDADPRVGNVVFGHEVAHLALQGWGAAQMKELLARMAETLYLPLDKVAKIVETNAFEAAKTAAFYGAREAGRLIPLPARFGVAAASEKLEAAADLEPPEFPAPDPMLQLKILRELSSVIEERPDINLLLEMVLEGVHRGVGMDRTLFALRTPSRNQLKARYALGWQKEHMQRQFVFELDPLKANIFSHVLDGTGALWVGSEPSKEIRGLLTHDVRELTKDAPFFVMAIEVTGQPIGLFYADRQPSGRDLDEESFVSFKHFCQQANLVLSQAHGAPAKRS